MKKIKINKKIKIIIFAAVLSIILVYIVFNENPKRKNHLLVEICPIVN